jgi:hypothetical protein
MPLTSKRGNVKIGIKADIQIVYIPVFLHPLVYQILGVDDRAVPFKQKTL